MVHEIPLDRIGHFDSDRIYLIQYNYRKQSSLYTWLECVLYVWVGQDEGGGERSLQEAIASTASIGPIKQVVSIIQRFSRLANRIHCEVSSIPTRSSAEVRTSAELRVGMEESSQ